MYIYERIVYFMLWKPLHHPSIQDGYMISPNGDIRHKDIDESKSYTASYHSNNGYDYAIFMNKAMQPQLFPIDEILGIVYIPIPDELVNKPITIKHINGDTRDISLDNMEWIEDIEEWRELCDPDIFPGIYLISSKGRIRNITNDTIVEGFESKGYRAVSLKSTYDENRYVQRNVNRLVALTFIDGSSASKCIVNHINGIKNDNTRKNLEWVTYSQNTYHSYLLGLSKKRTGEQSPFAKITEDIAKKIWLLLIDDPIALNGRPQTKGSPKKVMEYMIDEEPSVTCAIVGKIKSNRAWGDMTLDKKYVFEDTRITEDIAKKIWLLLIDDPIALNGRPQTKGSPKKVMEYMIDEVPNINDGIIDSIKHGKAWTTITGLKSKRS